MRTYLERLTTDALVARYRQGVALYEKAKAAPREFGHGGDTIAVRGGRFVRVSGAEAATNWAKHGLDQTVREICSRFIPVSA